MFITKQVCYLFYAKFSNNEILPALGPTLSLGVCHINSSYSSRISPNLIVETNSPSQSIKSMNITTQLY